MSRLTDVLSSREFGDKLSADLDDQSVWNEPTTKVAASKPTSQTIANNIPALPKIPEDRTKPVLTKPPAGINTDTSFSQEQVNRVTRDGGFGNLKSAVTGLFYGHNHAGIGNAAPANNEHHGYTFFTRPRLRLSYDNIISDRSFTPMLSTTNESIPRAVRAILDPLGAYGGSATAIYGSKTKQGAESKKATANNDFYGSSMIDPLCAFIPLLSNTLISLNGWPDPYMDTYTTRSGMYREEWSMVDSPAKIFNSFDLSSNFRNVVGDPVGYLIHAWTQYASLVKEGVFVPYPDSMIENEVDYNTRIYRVVLDPSKTFVTRIAACGAAFPTSNSVGSAYNYDEHTPYNRDIDQISVSWKCMGAMYYDPLVVRQFNRTTYMFNPDIAFLDKRVVGKDGVVRMPRGYVIIPRSQRLLFRNQGYPIINEDTMELEWWISEADYRAVVGN